MSLQLNPSNGGAGVGMGGGLPSLLKDGYKHTQGTEESVLKNIAACKALSDITRSSFGPNGLNKLVVNNLDKVFITSDAGTIMREINIEHPAAKLILMGAIQQEREMGDGTNLVIILAGEFLRQAEELIRLGIKPSLIIEGFEEGYAKAMELLTPGSPSSIVLPNQLCKEDIPKLFKNIIGSKLYGLEDVLCRLAMDALDIAWNSNYNNNNNINSLPPFNPDNIRCLKISGSSVSSSEVVPGFILQREPVSASSYGSIISKKMNKIAIFACPIGAGKTEAKGTVLIKNADELKAFSSGEEMAVRGCLEEIRDSGVNIVVTGDVISDIALHWCQRLDLIVFKIPSKFDLKRLCKAVGATPLARLGAPTEEEAGWCDLVETVEIGGVRCTIFKQTSNAMDIVDGLPSSASPSSGFHVKSQLATMVLRAATPSLLDDIERALEDAFATLKVMTTKAEFGLVSGAASAEIAISRSLALLGEETPSMNQYGIKRYGESFEIVLRTLAENSSSTTLSPDELLAKVHSAHSQSLHYAGVDLELENAVGASFSSSNSTASILEDASKTLPESLIVKRNAIRLATEAVLTILRIDQIIMSRPVGGPKPRQMGPQDSADD